MTQQKLINRDPEIMSGTPVFMGTRVPVETLIDYIEDGQPLDEFLEDFPSVKLEQAEELLVILRDMLLAPSNRP